MTTAEKLVRLRKEKGLSQLQLAEEINVSRQAISRWEVGLAVPSREKLKALSELYIKVSDLPQNIPDYVPHDHEIPVYASDGVTVIDSFFISSGYTDTVG